MKSDFIELKTYFSEYYHFYDRDHRMIRLKNISMEIITYPYKRFKKKNED